MQHLITPRQEAKRTLMRGMYARPYCTLNSPRKFIHVLFSLFLIDLILFPLFPFFFFPSLFFFIPSSSSLFSSLFYFFSPLSPQRWIGWKMKNCYHVLLSLSLSSPNEFRKNYFGIYINQGKVVIVVVVGVVLC